MKNNVVYCARYNEDKVAKQLGDCYILTSDNWDDWGYKTSFHVYIYKNGEKYENFSINVLFETVKTSSSTFNSELRGTPKNFVPLKKIKENHKFISLGNHYKEIKTIFPNNFEEILEVLNDIIYLEKNIPDSELLELKSTKGFEVSLCRYQSAKKILEEAKYVLYGGEELDNNRFQFDFNFKLSERKYSYHFNFVNNDLPHRINVLVGKNGCGKSQTLVALSEYFIDIEMALETFEGLEITPHPNFISNLMAVTYNIYEDFYISKEGDDISIEYKYLGFRDSTNNFDKNIPNLEAFNSFKKIYEKDRNNYAHSIQLNERTYRNDVIEFLNNAFDCDGIGLKCNNYSQRYKEKGFEFIEDYMMLRVETSFERLVKEISFDDFEPILYFTYNNEILYLSSGQQIFVNLVINILSLIKINSLILIDEPDNTLHPNLEIDFMRILQDILEEFDSFAIIATHSSIVVREVPSEFVRVIKIDEDNQPIITAPTISTFGADIRKITNYVFDDIFVENKPFEIWIEEEREKTPDFEDFKQNFQDKLSYDFLNYCYNFWDK